MSIFQGFKEELERDRKKKQQDEWFYYALLKIRKDTKNPLFVDSLHGSYGICYLLLKEFNCNPCISYLSFVDVNNYVNKHCEGWKHFSGSYGFPVPSHRENTTPAEMFWSTKSRWSGEYGKMRCDLLDYLIKEARKKVYNTRRKMKRLEERSS